jgi:hypothetical protein
MRTDLHFPLFLCPLLTLGKERRSVIRDKKREKRERERERERESNYVRAAFFSSSSSSSKQLGHDGAQERLGAD